MNNMNTIVSKTVETRSVGLFNLALPEECMDRIEERFSNLLRSHNYINGPAVKNFENLFSEYSKSRHAISVNSGTDALVIAMRSLGLGRGDEVIVPALTFYATAEAVLLTGATPVLVDIEPKTLNIDISCVEKNITKKTRAIVPVHLFGRPANMIELSKIAQQHNLYLVEDAAQAFGSTVNSSPLGHYSDVCCYSFYPTKNFGAAGDGGILTTNSDDIAQKARSLRVHATVGNYLHDDIGYTSRLDEIQAIVLEERMPYMANEIIKRVEIAKLYDDLLSDISDIEYTPFENGSAPHIYSIRVKERKSLQESLAANGIESRIYYPHALPDLPPLKRGGIERYACDHARQATSELLAIPMHPYLSEEDVQYVANCIRNHF